MLVRFVFVSRSTAFSAVAGFWGVGGTILCLRAGAWIGSDSVSPWPAFLSIAVASIVFYAGIFRRVVRRTAERLDLLPEPVSIRDVFPRSSLFLIAVMVLMGYGVRTLDVPTLILVIPYAMMGSSLIVGAASLYLSQKKNLQPSEESS